MSRRAVRVLVVESDRGLRAALRDHLEAAQFQVAEEHRGDGVIRLLESVPADAVVLDREMPAVDGLDLLTLLRDRWPDLPVIVLTALGRRDIAAEAAARGATASLEWPFRMADLIRVVADATRRAA